MPDEPSRNHPKPPTQLPQGRCPASIRLIVAVAALTGIALTGIALTGVALTAPGSAPSVGVPAR